MTLTNSRVRVGLIGAGGWARGSHLRQILNYHCDSTVVTAISEPSPKAYAATQKYFEDHDAPPPPNQPDLDRFLATYGGDLDAVIITSPHALHYQHAAACLEAGLDVLLEKPMTVSAAEAEALIDMRDRTGRHLVVAFQGSLSPQVRTAVTLLRSGELGDIVSISGTIWQNWRELVAGTWREQPELSGGGFMFDTGAHLLNTVADLSGEDFVEVAAWIDNRSRPVDILVSVMARLRSGALVTLNGAGDTIKTCKSDIYVFCTGGIVRTGAWGEKLQLQRQGHKQLRTVKTPPSSGTWEQFLAVRSGAIPNPSPPEVGLRMVRLWDAIRESAANNGQPVRQHGLFENVPGNKFSHF